MKTNVLRRIALPDGVKFTFPSWSPDGRTIALLRYVEGGVELWAVDVATGAAKALTPPAVNAVLGGIDWAPDGRRILVSLVPDGRGPAPTAPRVPAGPEVQISGGREAKIATFQDLNKNAFDEVLFDYYATSQTALVDVVSGEVRETRPAPGSSTRSPWPRPCSTSSPAGSSGLIPIPSPPTGSPIRWRSGTWTAGWSRSWPTCRPRRASRSTACRKGRATSRGWSTSPRRSSGPRPWTRAILKATVPFRDRYLTFDAPFTGEPKEAFKPQGAGRRPHVFRDARPGPWPPRASGNGAGGRPSRRPGQPRGRAGQDLGHEHPGPVQRPRPGGDDEPQDRRAGHPPGQGLDLPLRRRAASPKAIAPSSTG
ncbi:MAG: hypothetical protein MZU84_09135 [Sphingobacterium sp.]|nr:hypothetical protein [Sphingobacterium sp.]